MRQDSPDAFAETADTVRQHRRRLRKCEKTVYAQNVPALMDLMPSKRDLAWAARVELAHVRRFTLASLILRFLPQICTVLSCTKRCETQLNSDGL